MSSIGESFENFLSIIENLFLKGRFFFDAVGSINLTLNNLNSSVCSNFLKT